jgi:hypothetical protein
MCIAIVKNHDVPFPTLEEMSNCWDNNPDGFGFAIRKNGKVEIHKGYMKKTEMLSAYETLCKKYQNYDVLLHFRIATHGGVNPQNTHPFPIVDSKKSMGKTKMVCDKCLIHNGVLPIEPRSKNISDTAELALRLGEAGITNVEAVRLLDGLVGTNKIALMNGVGIVTLGDWIEKDGILFSNRTYSYPASYKWYTVPATSKYGWGCWASHRRLDDKGNVKDPYIEDKDFAAYVDKYEPHYKDLSMDEKEELYMEFCSDWNLNGADYSTDDYEYDYKTGNYIDKTAAKKK